MADKEPPYGTFAPKGLMAKILDFSRALPNKGLGKRLGFVCRRLGAPLLSGGPIDIESFGARFRLLPYNNVC